jgi:hypothetical protein
MAAGGFRASLYSTPRSAERSVSIIFGCSDRRTGAISLTRRPRAESVAQLLRQSWQINLPLPRPQRSAAAQPMTDDKYWKLDDPRGLLGQTRAVALMRSDKRASYKHMALIEFHWGWAHEKYDWTSLTSVRRMHSVLTERNPLGQAGMTTRHINSGNRDLCEWGWLFELDKGSGRNASRFLPNYTVFEIAAAGNFSRFLNGEISCSVSPVGKHNGYQILCVPYGDTEVCTYEVNANRFSVSPVGDKDPLTGTRLQDGATERGNDCGTATPPPPPPYPADGGVSPQGATTTTTLTGFDELWDAYDCKKGKPEARRAYAKLAPDAALHAAMVKAARAWQTRWAEQNKPDAPRFTLAKWIEREEFECEPPTAYKAKERPKKGKQPAQLTDVPDDDAPPVPLWARGKPSFWPVGSFLVKIVDSEVHRPEHTEEEHIILKFRIAGGDHHGEVHEHCICTQSAYVPSHAEEGKKTLAALMNIMGLETLKETEDMHDRVLRATANGTSIAYADVTDEEFDAFIPFDEAIERAALEAA